MIDYSEANFQALQILLKYIPNLKILSIYAPNNMEMADADRWQHLIESSLIHLHIFKFIFGYYAIDPRPKILKKLEEFRTDFWIKQHQWYTNYEINESLVSIYTMPYIGYEYRLTPTMNKYVNSLINHSNGFNNVKNITVWLKPIIKNLYYFNNIQSLTLTCEDDDDDQIDEYILSEKQIKFLHMTVNLSNIKHLIIDDECCMTPSLLLKILIQSPCLSELTIENNILTLYLKNSQICELLNKNIIKLDISDDNRNIYIKSNDIDSFYSASNCQEDRCYMRLDNLLLILSKCRKLSIIILGKIRQDIYSWIQINASTLNIDFYFTLID
ncbi:unnamed protein product [Rotaria sp. Silwood2]|nr:unnamed protein product [Rotaria sp. Silwood2]